MDIEKYVDQECRRIAKMANKQLLRPNRKIYIAWPFRERMFKLLTKEALKSFEPYWPDDYYHNEIIIVNTNTGWTRFYTKYNELLNEYSRHQNYLNHAEMSFEQHLKNAFLYKVKKGIEYNLRQVLTEHRPSYSFKEYDITNLLISCYALTLIHDGKFHVPYQKLMKYFRDSADWYVIEPCSTFMEKNCKYDLNVKLIDKRLLFRTEQSTYLIWLEFNFNTNQGQLKVEITSNPEAPKIDGIAMTDEGLLVYEMLHYGEGNNLIKSWTVNETTSSKPNPFAFYGLDENGQ
ncbi:hypothetical protein [Pseudomonas fluorescens]|uniref:hypothetical protein n=1 Tax=Pseudomonas fluorescens TaxID=294 RepID=UPI00058A7305|nr:hypothetical protein [Pseudomonas fluorescens]CEL31202.1 hypothetical protein SRM1_04566 [Pseudomonas fluorescens]